jgi:hypothetical protein
MVLFRSCATQLIILVLGCSNIGFSQKTGKMADASIVSCTGEIHLVDSEYLFYPQLIVNSNSESIRIPKRLYYDVGVHCREIESASLTLQRLVNKTYAYLLTDAFSLPIIDEDFQKWRTYSKNSRLNDTVNLKFQYPLDIGKYRISFEIVYYYHGKKRITSSDWVYFDVLYPPKNSIF